MDEEIILGGMAILFAGMVVLVPVLGLTLRFAIKPFFDSWAEIQRGQLRAEKNSLETREIQLIEAELQQVQQTLQALVEAQDFQRQLRDPVAPLEALPTRPAR
jgi:hypothetical protein